MSEHDINPFGGTKKKSKEEISELCEKFLKENYIDDWVLVLTLTCEHCNDDLCRAKIVNNIPIFECPTCKHQWEIIHVHKGKKR